MYKSIQLCPVSCLNYKDKAFSHCHTAAAVSHILSGAKFAKFARLVLTLPNMQEKAYFPEETIISHHTSTVTTRPFRF